MKIVIIGLILLAFSLPIMAQINLPRPNFNPYRTDDTSLLSLNRVSMNHSLGFSAGVTSGGHGYYLSRYTNHLKYIASSKLDLELDLNLVNFGSTSSGFSFNDDNRSKVIPEFRLNYRPTESIQIRVEFNQYGPWSVERQPWMNRW